MSDPERLLSGSGAEHDFERLMLDSLRAVAVPAEAKGAVWAALGAHGLQAAAATGSAASAASLWRGALRVAVTSKAALAVPVVIAALTVGVLHQRTAAAPVAAAQLAPVVVTAAAQPPEPTPIPSPEAEPALQPERSVSPGMPRKDRLALESALLTRARAELRAGDPAGAQALLSRIQRRLGNGALHQEREVLAIEALAAQGNAAAADRAARAFIAAHPESPHAPALRRFTTAN